MLSEQEIDKIAEKVVRKMKEYGVPNPVSIDSDIVEVFNRALLRLPKSPDEIDQTRILIDKHGKDKVIRAYKTGSYDGCKKLKTLIGRIDNNGVYIPFETEKEFTYQEACLIDKTLESFKRLESGKWQKIK